MSQFMRQHETESFLICLIRWYGEQDNRRESAPCDGACAAGGTQQSNLLINFHLCFNFKKQFLPFFRGLLNSDIYICFFHPFVMVKGFYYQNQRNNSAKADDPPHVQEPGSDLKFITVGYD